MKITLKTKALLVIALLSLSLLSFGQTKVNNSILVRKYNKPVSSVNLNDQERSDFTIQRAIALTDTTGEKDVEFTINADTNALGILINCHLEKGTVSIEIRDPQGNKKGVFKLKETTNTSSGWREQVSGKITKEFKNPIKGIWTIRIRADTATII
jgi:hypothetical protein